MANFKPVTDEMRRDWDKWVKERPTNVKAVAEKFYPWILYKLKQTGQRVFLVSFYESPEGVKLKIGVSGEFNFLVYEREVFGINPDDLEECDLPSTDEPLGVFSEIFAE